MACATRDADAAEGGAGSVPTEPEPASREESSTGGSTATRGATWDGRRHPPSAHPAWAASDELPKHGKITSVYDLGERLGRGATSTVYAGTHRASKMPVAIKVMNVYTEKRRRQSIAELGLLIKIRRRLGSVRHIAHMLDAFVDDVGGRVYVVMELCRGGELFDQIVKRGHYSERTASKLIASIACALQDLHQMDIIHCDLKPENILLRSQEDDGADDPALADFGLSYDASSGESRNIVGTPAYLAPEVLLHKAYSPACDVWGLGVVLYILLSGTPPFYGDSDLQLRNRICTGDYHFHRVTWGHISGPAKELVTRCLQPDREKRISIPEFLRHPWIAEHAAPTTHLPTVVAQLRKFNARLKLRAACIAVAASTLGTQRWIRKVRKARLTEDVLTRMRAAFDTKGASGTVSLEEFTDILASLGLGSLPADKLFDAFDENGDGRVDRNEFVRGMHALCAGSERGVRMYFQIFDEDSSESITREELVNLLRLLPAPEVDADNDDEVQAQVQRYDSLFDRLDADGSGTISFEEFKVAALKERLLADAFFGVASAAVTPKAGDAAGGAGGGEGRGSDAAPVSRSRSSGDGEERAAKRARPGA